MKRTLVVRARIMSVLFSLAALLIIGRLYFVQVVHGEDYRREAEAQYVEQTPDTQERGTIFFTAHDGEHPAAAVMQTGYRIAIRPSAVSNADGVFTQLNAITPIDRDRYFAAFARENDPYEEVAFRVPDDAAARVRALKIPGVLLVQDQWRFYPSHELAAQVVGFVAYQGDTKTGVYGLERSWQDTLAENASGLYVNPFAEIFTNIAALVADDPTSHEGSVITSIEPSVQAQLEQTLEGVMKTYTPKLAGGIVMDPHTGEIVAMANRPAFDPNTYNTVSNPSVYADQLVEGTYEMGSIMKPLTMAAGIDAGAVSPATTYDDTGCIKRSGRTICNYDHKARGVIPMQQVLSQSLNVGATFVADTMGHDVFAKYIHAYGLGERTGIDLPNEARGQIAAIDNGVDVDYASASFGQGIAVSAIEMTRALASLANGGVLPNPHVVTGVRYASGITRHIDAGHGPRVLSATTTEVVTDMLTTVFDDALLHGELKMDRYTVAAKTGTAQIAIPGGGGYYPDRYLHSFFGYFPAHDPKFIVFLFVVEPHGVEYASASLAHPFNDIAKFLISYYDIPPDR